MTSSGLAEVDGVTRGRRRRHPVGGVEDRRERRDIRAGNDREDHRACGGVDDRRDLQLRWVGERHAGERRGVARPGQHLARAQRAIVERELAELAAEARVGVVERAAEVVGERAPAADVAGVERHAGVPGHLDAVEVQAGGRALERVRQVHPPVARQRRTRVRGLLGRPVPRRDARAVGAVARREEVSLADTGCVGVAEAVDEVRARLRGADLHLRFDRDVLDARQEVVGQVDVVVGAVERERVTLPRGSADDRAVVAVARSVGHGGACGIREVVAQDLAVLVGLDRRRARREALELGGRDRDDGAVPRARGQVVVGCHGPRRVGDVRGLERDVAAPAVLVDEQVELVAVDVAGVRREGRRPLDRARARVAADARVDHRPRRQGRPQLGRRLLDDVAASGGAGALVLREPVVDVAGLDHRRVDARHPVLPDLRLAEGDEVACGRVQHPVVRAARVTRVALGVELRGPEHHERADRLVVVRLGRPRVAGGVGRDLHVPLLRPVHEVVRLPHLEVQRALALRGVPAGAAADREVGGDQVERVALGRADDERVAQALRAVLRGQRGQSAVELGPVERVVAVARGEVDVLAGERVAREVGERVALERVEIHGGAHLRDELARGGRVVPGECGGEGHVGVRVGAHDHAVGRDDPRCRRCPGDLGAGGRTGKREVAAHVVDVRDRERGGRRVDDGLVVFLGDHGRLELLRAAGTAARDGRGERDGCVAVGCRGPRDDARRRDHLGVARRPRDGGAVRSGRGERQVALDRGEAAEVEHREVAVDLDLVGGVQRRHLLGAERDVVDAEVAQAPREVPVGRVHGSAEVVRGRDAVADRAGRDRHVRVLGDLHAVEVDPRRVRGVVERVGDRLPHAASEVRAARHGLLGRPVARRDRRPVRVARGEQVAVAGTRRGVAHAVDEVRRGLRRADEHLGAHRDRGETGQDVVRQPHMVVDTVEPHALAAGEGGAAHDRGVAAVARLVGGDRAARLVEGVVGDETFVWGGERGLGGRERDRDAEEAGGHPRHGSSNDVVLHCAILRTCPGIADGVADMTGVMLSLTIRNHNSVSFIRPSMSIRVGRLRRSRM